MRYRWCVAAFFAAGLLAAQTTPVLAASPRFVWQSLQVHPAALPGGGVPFTVFARISAAEEIHYYTLPLAAGVRETIGALVLAGAPPVEVTVETPSGSEFSLPSLPRAQTLWLGGIRLQRFILYPYIAGPGGTYVLAIQPGTPGQGQPYAIQGDPVGRDLLVSGHAGLADLLRGPVIWLQSLLWLWG
jgi:hypothetical protein